MIYKVGRQFSSNTGEKMARGGFWQLTWCGGTRHSMENSSIVGGPWPEAPPGSLRQALAVRWMSQKKPALTVERPTMECSIYLGFQQRCKKHPEGSYSHIKKKKRPPSDTERN